jgi:hypothetical protein
MLSFFPSATCISKYRAHSFELEREILRVDILCKRIKNWTLLTFLLLELQLKWIYRCMAWDTVSQSFQRNDLICIYTAEFHSTNRRNIIPEMKMTELIKKSPSLNLTTVLFCLPDSDYGSGFVSQTISEE